ncbi:methionine gamma-lyase family protein [Bacillus sp. SL00103]
MYQGFFLAPHVVAQSLKGAVFTARFLEKPIPNKPAVGMRKRNRFNSIRRIWEILKR